MAKRNTTPKERKEYLDKQQVNTALNAISQGGVKKFFGYLTGRGGHVPTGDMSFIDKKGNIVRPNRDEYYAKKSSYNDVQYNEAIKLNKQYDSLVSEYGKSSEKVYNFERDKLGMHQNRKSSRLEGTLAIIGLAGGIFFLSSNLTGNVISSFNQTSSNIIGAVLFFVGIVEAFFYFKGR